MVALMEFWKEQNYMHVFKHHLYLDLAFDPLHNDILTKS